MFWPNVRILTSYEFSIVQMREECQWRQQQPDRAFGRTAQERFCKTYS